MKIDIKFNSKFTEDRVLSWSEIPCHCRINQDGFIIDLSSALRMDVFAKVISWDQKNIDHRVPALGGGNCTHDYPGLITIEKEKDSYLIVSLSMFTSGLWCSVISNRELSAL